MKRIFMTIILSIFTVIISSNLLVSCDSKEDEMSDENSNFTDTFGNPTSKNFIGRIVDVNHYPIPNAIIQIGNTSTQTDVNGMFIINNATVYEKFAYITAKKSGYIDGSRALIPTSGANNVTIMLLSDVPTATVNSGAASEFSLPSGTKVTFDGAFQTENGVAYSGTVRVTLNELSPSDANIDKLMPGMLLGQDAEGKAKLLETFGMMNVELKGSAGQKLQIASGHTAEITMDIDSNQLPSSPNSIPLWHFDAINGYWKQEGTATKIGSKYIGNVAHFSWWNYDIPIDFANLSLTVLDNVGNPLSNVRIDIVRQNLNNASSYTNVNGIVSGIIPANETLSVSVYSFCGTSVYNTTIGPFAANSNNTLPNIILSSLTNFTSLNGVLQKCNNSNVTNGYVLFNNENYSSYIPITNGNFNITTLYCSSAMNFTIEGFDIDNQQSTGVLNYTFTPINTTIGTITTCTSIMSYLSYKLDNKPTKYFFGSNVDVTYDPILYISTFDGGSINDGNIALIGEVNSIGTYTTSNFVIECADPEIAIINSVTPNTLIFTITNAAPMVGSYLDMTFNGVFTNATGTHTLTGTVHAIRSF